VDHGAMILDRRGAITIQYEEVDPAFYATSGTIGIEDRLGNIGLEVAFNTPYVHDSLVVRISRTQPWLTYRPDRV